MEREKDSIKNINVTTKLRVKDLQDLCERYGIEYKKSDKKDKLLKTLQEFKDFLTEGLAQWRKEKGPKLPGASLDPLLELPTVVDEAMNRWYDERLLRIDDQELKIKKNTRVLSEKQACRMLIEVSR